jgi:hypothetical protein
MRSSREWLVPLTGVAFVVVGIVSFAIGGEPPDAKDDVQDIVNHYVDNKDSVQISAVLGTVAGALLIFFFGYLRKVLHAAEGERGMLSLVAFVGAAIVATGFAIDATIAFALAEAADDISPTGVQALQALWDNDFLPIALGTLVVLFAAGLSIVINGALPRWMGWIALVLAIVSVTPVGFAAFLGTVVWILIASVLLSMRARAAGTPPATVTGPPTASP